MPTAKKTADTKTTAAVTPAAKTAATKTTATKTTATKTPAKKTTARKSTAKKPITPWSAAGASLDDLGPCERMAHDIVAEHRDLLPSVDRIMSETMSDDERLKAMNLFQTSLGTLGDPNRDPRVAISTSMSKKS